MGAFGMLRVALLAGVLFSNSQAGGSDFRWHGKLKPGALVDICGLNGSIHVQPSRSDEVELIAVKNGLSVAASQVSIKSAETPDGVAISAIYLTENNQASISCASGEKW